MFWQRVRVALLTSMVALGVSFTAARADEGKKVDDKKGDDKKEVLPVKPAPVPAPAPCAHGPGAHGAPAFPATRKVLVEECVPEYYETTRTVNRMQEFEEKYTAYRCEQVPEKRTRVVNYCEQVPVKECRTRTVCVKVPVCEERCVMEKHWVCKEVTTYKTKVVDKGHWECREVPCDNGGGLFAKFKKKDCCDPCDACPKTRTERVWVPCKVCVQEPCTTTQKVCEYRPVKKMVNTCKTEVRHENYEVTVCKSIPRTRCEEYTVCVEKRIPYEACRKVCKCVPVVEKVQACRMVKRCVEKEVPVCPEPSPCDFPCGEPCGKRARKCCK